MVVWCPWEVWAQDSPYFDKKSRWAGAEDLHSWEGLE